MAANVAPRTANVERGRGRTVRAYKSRLPAEELHPADQSVLLGVTHQYLTAMFDAGRDLDARPRLVFDDVSADVHARAHDADNIAMRGEHPRVSFAKRRDPGRCSAPIGIEDRDVGVVTRTERVDVGRVVSDELADRESDDGGFGRHVRERTPKAARYCTSSSDRALRAM